MFVYFGGSYWQFRPSRFLIRFLISTEGDIQLLTSRKIRKLEFGPEIYKIFSIHNGTSQTSLMQAL